MISDNRPKRSYTWRTVCPELSVSSTRRPSASKRLDSLRWMAGYSISVTLASHIALEPHGTLTVVGRPQLSLIVVLVAHHRRHRAVVSAAIDLLVSYANRVVRCSASVALDEPPRCVVPSATDASQRIRAWTMLPRASRCQLDLPAFGAWQWPEPRRRRTCIRNASALRGRDGGQLAVGPVLVADRVAQAIDAGHELSRTGRRHIVSSTCPFDMIRTGRPTRS